MPRQTALPSGLPPRLVSREGAAAYVCVSHNTFDEMVRHGRMPRPQLLGGRRRAWDVRALGISIDQLPVDNEDAGLTKRGVTLMPRKRPPSVELWRDRHGKGPSLLPNGLCCKSLFAPLIADFSSCRRDFRVNMWGTSSPGDKLTGDFRNEPDATSISDRGLFRLLVGNLSPGVFRLLQHNPPKADMPKATLAALRLATVT
jgi:hypothetical protein